MDAIASIPLIGGFLSTVLPFVVVLGIVVFVHEFGHYIVARWCGIRSEVFSIGFGPVLWSRRDRRGTLWQVAALPLGGYVKFLGDADGSSRADPKALERMTAAERRAELPRRHGLAADADGAGRAGLQLPADHRRLRRHRDVAGRADRAADDRRDRGAARRRAAAAAGRRAARGERHAGRRASRTSTAAAQAMPAPGPMQVRVERDGADARARRRPIALPPLVQGVEPLSPASEAGLRRGDLILTADGTPLGSFEDLRAGGARLGRPHDPARGLARRRDARRSTSRPRSATPTTARAASSGG